MNVKNADNTVRVRIAPSPTGYPHIGTIYQALFNYAFAKKHHGSFIVRIEDTDQTRFVADAEEAIFNALDWFGLIEDESSRKGGNFGPYRQSERLELYHQYAQELIDKGYAEFAYYPKKEAVGKKEYGQQNAQEKVSVEPQTPPAPTSIKEMLADKEQFVDWVVRMRVPKDEKIVVDDAIRGNIEFDTNQVSAQVLLKSDGFPTYHLGAVVDDHLMQITHIVRAEEWLSSFPKHWLLYRYFQWPMPPVFHTATLRNPDKSKLSKRQGHTNVNWYKEQGFLPETILNYLALLGWSHPEEKEIFSLDEFISLFDLKDIKPIPPIFDLTKLEWMNGVYIRDMENSKLLEKLMAYDQTIKEIDKTLLDQFIELAKTRMKTLKDFSSLVMPFVKPNAVVLAEEQKRIQEAVRQSLESTEHWDKEQIVQTLKEVTKQNNVNFKFLYKITIGAEFGLPLADVFEILGKEKTLVFFS